MAIDKCLKKKKFIKIILIGAKQLRNLMVESLIVFFVKKYCLNIKVWRFCQICEAFSEYINLHYNRKEI